MKQMAKKNTAPEPETRASMLSNTDFLFSLRGEDPDGKASFVYSLHERCAMLGVFDGRGGACDRQVPVLRNKSGGWLASRTVCAAWRAWFESWDAVGEPPLEELSDRIRGGLNLCRSRCGGDGNVPLSASAAAALCRPARGGMDVLLLWAGNSRVFLLDSEGLALLTEDDPEDADPIGDLAAAGGDGSRPEARGFHSARLTMGRPGLLFAATAGCLRQIAAPTDFEYLLLGSLQNAPNVLSWEKALAEKLTGAGEDCALSGIALNAGSFDNLKRLLAGRCGQVYRSFIRDPDACGEEEKRQLLTAYHHNFCRLLCRR